MRNLSPKLNLEWVSGPLFDLAFHVQVRFKWRFDDFFNINHFDISFGPSANPWKDWRRHRSEKFDFSLSMNTKCDLFFLLCISNDVNFSQKQKHERCKDRMCRIGECKHTQNISKVSGYLHTKGINKFHFHVKQCRNTTSAGENLSKPKPHSVVSILLKFHKI